MKQETALRPAWSTLSDASERRKRAARGPGRRNASRAGAIVLMCYHSIALHPSAAFPEVGEMDLNVRRERNGMRTREGIEARAPSCRTADETAAA